MSTSTQMWDLRSEISDPRSQIWDLRSEISDLRSQIWDLRPNPSPHDTTPPRQQNTKYWKIKVWLKRRSMSVRSILVLFRQKRSFARWVNVTSKFCFRKLVFRCFWWDFGSEISDLRSRIWDLKSEISDLRSEIWDLRSEISDLRSQIWDHI